MRKDIIKASAACLCIGCIDIMLNLKTALFLV